MSRKIYQYRYYGENNNQNQPLGDNPITAKALLSGEAFSDKTPIVQLGVQSTPGLRLNFNNGLYDVIVGSTGVYELEMETGAYINKMALRDEDLVAVANASPEGQAEKWPQGKYIIIDVVYGEDE